MYGKLRLGPLHLPCLLMPASEMGMPDPIPTFTGLVTRIHDSHLNFARIHVVEGTDALLTLDPRNPLRGSQQSFCETSGAKAILYDIIIANYERDMAIKVVEKEGGLVSFGRYFISNVDVGSHIPSKRALIDQF